MMLEVDVAAHQVLNRHRLSSRNIHHELRIPGPPLPEEPLVLSVRELWEEERQRRVAKGLSPSPEIPVDLSARSRGPGADWVAETRWWAEIKKRIESERGKESIKPSKDWEKWVMTTFQSVEALWENDYRTWRPDRFPSTGQDKQSQVHDAGWQSENPYARSTGFGDANNEETEGDEYDVNETMLSGHEMDILVEQEEAEAMLHEDEDSDHDEEVDLEDDPLLEDEESHTPKDGPLEDLHSDVFGPLPAVTEEFDTSPP